MIKKALLILSVMISGLAIGVSAQTIQGYRDITSGIPWFDDRGIPVSAHGANIVFDHGRYYLFGEAHIDNSNAFAGFNCYSSTDLYNWKFESVALPVQPSGKLGPNHVGERPKVLRCPKTGEYVMLMHSDSLSYTSQYVGYATASSITGPYTFRGPILFHGEPVKKWDMGSFQDSDGSGYLLIHGGLMYKLADDYKSLSELVVDNKWRGCEAPAMVKKNGVYFWLASDLTSWEKNDNVYYTATSLKGPWTLRGNFAPKGTLTWNSQTTFVLPVIGKKDTTYMFMGDRWSYPKQASAATYIWQPLTFSGTSLSIPQFIESWQLSKDGGQIVNTPFTGRQLKLTDKAHIALTGHWDGNSSGDSIRSDEKAATITVKFKGGQIGVYGMMQPNSGYADVALINSEGKVLLHTFFDGYCKYPAPVLLYKSPVMKKGDYQLKITVMGEHGNWSDKAKHIYGSTGNFVSIKKIVVHD